MKMMVKRIGLEPKFRPKRRDRRVFNIQEAMQALEKALPALFVVGVTAAVVQQLKKQKELRSLDEENGEKKSSCLKEDEPLKTRGF